MPVRVQREVFEIGAEIENLRRGQSAVGAIASFIGTVRDVNSVAGHSDAVSSLTLEHYPGMTERALEEICSDAKRRFDIFETLVVHRYGELQPMDPIVLVVVTSAHRGEAFRACEFIIDFLKTQAPFWKKEVTPEGSRWVDSRELDERAAERWTKT